MNLTLTIIIGSALYFFIKTLTVYSWRQQFNYYVLKYHANYDNFDSVPQMNQFKWDNYVHEKELVAIIFNPFKINPNNYFSYKPGHKVIHENYLI